MYVLYLLGMPGCSKCIESKRQLEDAGVVFDTKDLTKPENLEIAQRFGIKIAGVYVYDDESDTVQKVSAYL